MPTQASVWIHQHGKYECGDTNGTFIGLFLEFGNELAKVTEPVVAAIRDKQQTGVRRATQFGIKANDCLALSRK
jgi:hypothetical protein